VFTNPFTTIVLLLRLQAIRALRAIRNATPSVGLGNNFDAQIPAAIKAGSFFGASFHNDAIWTDYFV
jgi:hypothetical protein